jgi:hypothetical protein
MRAALLSFPDVDHVLSITHRAISCQSAHAVTGNVRCPCCCKHSVRHGSEDRDSSVPRLRRRGESSSKSLFRNPSRRLHKRWAADKEMDSRRVSIDSKRTRASVEMLIRKGRAVGESYAFRAPRWDAVWAALVLVAKLLKRQLRASGGARSRARMSCRAGAQDPGGTLGTPKQTYTKTYTPPLTREGPPALKRWRAFTYDSRDGRI